MKISSEAHLVLIGSQIGVVRAVNTHHLDIERVWWTRDRGDADSIAFRLRQQGITVEIGRVATVAKTPDLRRFQTPCPTKALPQ